MSTDAPRLVKRLSSVALSVLGEFSDGRLVFMVLTSEALTGVRVEVTSAMSIRSNGNECTRRGDIGEVAAFRSGRAVVQVPNRFSYTVSAEGYDQPLGPYEVCISTMEADDPKYLFLSCDSDWHLPVRSTWDAMHRVEGVRAAFHMGDQVYHDLEFARIRNTLRRMTRGDADDEAKLRTMKPFREHVRQVFFSNYMRSWRAPHKRDFLATHSNIMFGDDHEITDDNTMANLLEGEKVFEFIKDVAIDVYQEIQGGLRHVPCTGKTDYFHKIDGNVLFVCIGRMYTMRHDVPAYMRHLEHVVTTCLEADPAVLRRVNRLVVVMSKPPLHKRPACGRPVVTDETDFGAFFNQMFNVWRTRMFAAADTEVRVIAGDLHAHHNFRVDSAHPTDEGRANSIEVTVTPAIVSCVPVWGSRLTLNSTLATATELRRRKANGFLVYHSRSREVRLHSRRYWSHFLRNEMLIGWRVARSRLGRMTLTPHQEGTGAEEVSVDV